VIKIYEIHIGIVVELVGPGFVDPKNMAYV